MAPSEKEFAASTSKTEKNAIQVGSLKASQNIFKSVHMYTCM